MSISRCTLIESVISFAEVFLNKLSACLSCIIAIVLLQSMCEIGILKIFFVAQLIWTKRHDVQFIDTWTFTMEKEIIIIYFFAEENDMQFSEIPINSKEKIKQIPEQTHEIMPETIHFICPIIHMIGSPLSEPVSKTNLFLLSI